jgi:tRNA-binding EMAP/Myf-like protein
MQFPESWLREFCNPPLTTAELADLLTMSGMEVEDLRPAAPPFTKVVVGEVLSVERHPNADKLTVCRVDAGAGRTLNIVCGAPNVKAGIKVPTALVGAELPPAEDGGEPFRIKLGQLRGVESEGMLCSGSGRTSANTWRSTTPCSRSSSRPTSGTASACTALPARCRRSPARPSSHRPSRRRRSSTTRSCA